MSVLLAEGSSLIQGEGGVIGVIVVALVGFLGVGLQVRRAGKDSSGSERAELMRGFREERDNANRERDAAIARAEAVEHQNDLLQEQLLEARGKQQTAEYERRKATDRITELTKTIGGLKQQLTALTETVEHKLPDAPGHTEDGNATATSANPA